MDPDKNNTAELQKRRWLAGLPVDSDDDDQDTEAAFDWLEKYHLPESGR